MHITHRKSSLHFTFIIVLIATNLVSCWCKNSPTSSSSQPVKRSRPLKSSQLPSSSNEQEKKAQHEFKNYKQLADQRDAEAQVALGKRYQDGRGVSQSNLQVLKRSRKAPSQGGAQAITDLGAMYEDGNGVPQNLEQAFKLYEEAAEAGNLEAQHKMGYRIFENLRKTRVMPTNEEGVEAAKWYGKAMDQGDSDAPYYLGRMYEHGYGIEKKDKKAAEMYLESAERDFEETVDAAEFESKIALFDVARMYLEERVDSELFEKMFTFLQKGAVTSKASENYVVLLLLGLMYERGHGVNPNPQKAEEYLTKAAAHEYAGGKRTKARRTLDSVRNYSVFRF